VVDDADKLTSITVGGSAVKTYGYDAAGRTTSVATSAGTTTLAYDYEGRISTITYPSSATNSFTYNGLDTRVGKVDSAGTTTYRRDGDDVLSPVLEAGGTKFTPGISRRTGTSSYFYHQDRMGSAVRQTNSTQGSLTSRQYDAFGNIAYVGGTWVGPFGFVGGEGYQEDSDSGLQLLGHRYYDSSTGRFLTRDPIKDGRNWYGYCDNNPLKFVDLTGHHPVLLVIGAALVIGVIVGAIQYHNGKGVDGEESARNDGIQTVVGYTNGPVGVPTEPLDGLDVIYKGTKPISALKLRTAAVQAYVNGDEDAGEQSDDWERGEPVIPYENGTWRRFR
jgi:RHS repeat-associated protein